MNRVQFMYLILVIFLHFIDCSQPTEKICSIDSDNGKNKNNEGEIEEVLKNCTVNATDLAKYFDECFKEYGHCLSDIKCLQDRDCLTTKECQLTEANSKGIVSHTTIWKNIHTLYDICDVNATKISAKMDECIESEICLTKQEYKTFYQNLSHYMCNISKGFYDLSFQFLKKSYSNELLNPNKKEKKQSADKCKQEKVKNENQATLQENNNDKDCWVNATDVCSKLESCIQKRHEIPSSLIDCDIDAEKLANKSLECLEHIKCLTKDQEKVWFLNISSQLYKICIGFQHLSSAFWNISERYEEISELERLTRDKDKEWKCEMPKLPVKPESKTTEAYDKKKYYGGYEDKKQQAAELVKDI